MEAFKVITEFVDELKEEFASSSGKGGGHGPVRALLLYHRLISKMGFRDEVYIQKHLSLFKEFCISNRDAIKNQVDMGNLKVSFTEKIYIDVSYCIHSSKDEDTQQAIWKYLLTLSALLDKDSQAKDILKTLSQHLDTPIPPQFEQMMGSVLGMMGQSGSNGGINPLELVNQIAPKLKDIDMPQLLGSLKGIMGDMMVQLEQSDDKNIKSILNIAKDLSDNLPKD